MNKSAKARGELKRGLLRRTDMGKLSQNCGARDKEGGQKPKGRVRSDS